MATVDPRKKNQLGAPADMLPTAIVRPDAALSGSGGGSPQITAPGMLPTAIAHPSFSQRFLNGPMPSTPDKGSAMANADTASLQRPSNVLGIPTGYGAPAAAPPVPGTASPDVNPQALGTQLGSAIRDTQRSAANDQVAILNGATRGGAGLVNAATYLPRTILGGLRDTSRAAVGLAPSPNAGQPVGGVVAPQALAKPFIQAPVNFVTGGQANPAAPSPGAPAAAAPVDNMSAGNLATALRFPSQAAPFAGVTGSASTTQLKVPGINSGVSVGGRSLPVGAMVNGVPTFSDGSGTGAIPRTMDDKTIKNYGNNLSRADVGALGNVLAGDVSGTPVSTDQQVAGLVRNAVVPITGSRPSAEQFATADRNAIALQDPRSAAGIAARNLAVEAQYGGTGTARRNASSGLAQLTAGTNQAGLAAQQAESQQATTAQQGQNALDQTTLQGQNTLANTALENRGKLQLPRAGTQVTLADGSLGLQDNITGAVTPSKMADGSTAKALVTRDDSSTKRSNEIMDQLNKGVQEQMKAYLPTKEAPTPTTEMIAQWREQNARAIGLPLGTDPKTGRRVVNINGQAVPL